jgi:hypothetical protein
MFDIVASKWDIGLTSMCCEMEAEIRESKIDYKIAVVCGKVAYTIDLDVAKAVGEERLKEIAELFSDIREDENPLSSIKFAEHILENLEIQGESMDGFSDSVYTIKERK